MSNFILAVECKRCGEETDMTFLLDEEGIPYFKCKKCDFIGEISQFNYLIEAMSDYNR